MGFGLLERRKIYDRPFLLELRNHPLSLKRPEGLPSLEIVRNKVCYIISTYATLTISQN
jgi:hypothetical protein